MILKVGGSSTKVPVGERGDRVNEELVKVGDDVIVGEVRAASTRVASAARAGVTVTGKSGPSTFGSPLKAWLSRRLRMSKGSSSGLAD